MGLISILLISFWVCVAICTLISSSDINAFHQSDTVMQANSSSDFHVHENKIACISLKNYEGLRYTGKIHVGSNLQELDVQFDTGSYFLVVPDLSLAEKFYHTFDCTSSLTFAPISDEKITITYGTSKAIGNIVQETISFGDSLTLASEMIVLAKDWHRNSKTSIDGIFGLGFERYPEKFMESHGIANMQTSFNFVRILKNQGVISKSQFAFFLSENLNQPGTAEFMLGGYEPKYTKGQMTFLDVISDNQWAVRLNSIAIGGEKIRITSGNGLAVLDTGTSVITFPHKIYQHVENYIKKTTKCKEIKNLLCECHKTECNLRPSDFPDIELEFDGLKAILRGEAYVKNSKQGTLVEILSFDMNEEVIILGDTFLRQFVTLFDIDEARIGLAPSINYVERNEIEQIDV